MRDCERAVQTLASARVYCCGFQMIKKAYFNAVIALDGFPGTKEELEEFMEAMRCVEDMELRIQKAAKELAEDYGEGSE